MAHNPIKAAKSITVRSNLGLLVNLGQADFRFLEGGCLPAGAFLVVFLAQLTFTLGFPLALGIF
jgi:hypothetical protein